MDNNNWNNPDEQNPYDNQNNDNQYNLNGQYGADNQYNANGQYNANNQYNANGQYDANGNAGNQYNVNGQYNANQYSQYNQYGSSGQYGNMGGTPLNKNGQPVPNRFGMKLTFSILEIISCNLISLICGIIGCIFTCKANTAYKEGRWNDFLSHAKASAISLWIGLVGIVLQIIAVIVICVASFHIFKTFMEDPSKMQHYLDEIYDGNYDDAYGDLEHWLNEYGYNDDGYADDEYTDDGYRNEEIFTNLGNYYEFELQGKHIELPIAYTDFVQLGFVVMPDEGTDNTIRVDEGYACVSYSDAEGNYLGTVNIMNPTEQDIPIEQGIIAGISISNDQALGGEFCPEFTFGNGYTFDTSEDTLVSELGECAYEYHSKDTEYDASYYEWHPESYKDTYYNRIQVDFWDGVMETVYIDYAGE